MTRLYRAEDLEHVDDELALLAMHDAFDDEESGRTVLPKRIDTKTSHGFLRVMPAILGDMMGFKVMTLVEGVGTRYLVLLHAVSTGELLAIFDADELTRLRTAAVTALAAQVIVRTPPASLAIIGTGFEAEAQLRAVARLWPKAELVCHSPTPEHRERFARAMSNALGRSVGVAGSSAEALRGRPVVLLATKAKVPVIDGTDFAPGAAVLSIGATRLDLRELDRATFARAGTVVGDDPTQLETESGDIAEALRDGALGRERIVSIARVRKEPSLLRTDAERDLVVLKTVGTALQDLAIARAVHRGAAAGGLGEEIGDLARLKPFAAQKSTTPAGATRA
ncbi:MAG TPA: hypothetical protein VHG53_02030 [Candidatus Limnocylindria bacterium]|nr:hypothetical protein [Candidatus Limnocylindria bacterium]